MYFSIANVLFLLQYLFFFLIQICSFTFYYGQKKQRWDRLLKPMTPRQGHAFSSTSEMLIDTKRKTEKKELFLNKSVHVGRKTQVAAEQHSVQPEHKNYFDHCCYRLNINSQHTQYSGWDTTSCSISSKTNAKFMNIFLRNP